MGFRSVLAKTVDRLSVEHEPGVTTAQLMLINNDLKPVEPDRRQWRAWNYVGFWVADSFNINTWMIASSMIVDGLTWWQAWLCVWAGYFISGFFICATARIGAVYHIPFPVAIRASFGIYGSLWPVFNRAAMACIWYGQCVTLMIRSIWTSYTTLPNGLPASSAIYLPVHKIRHLFTVKAYYAPCAGIAFMAWSIARAGSIGPMIHAPPTAQGSTFRWAVIKALMSAISNFATLIVNAPDFARVARKPKDAFWSQLFTIPTGFAVTSLIGILVSSASAVMYGSAVWNPLDLLAKFLDNASSAERFGVFVISLGFALAQVGTNIAANSISAGTDLTALLPKFINIRRGGYACAIVGFAMCPWHLLSSSNNFTTYLSAYAVFLSSIAGPMLCDYYIVRRGHLDVHHLYSAKKHYVDPITGEMKKRPYRYFYGFSLHAYAAYISGIMINIVGFVGAVGMTVPIGATYIYNVNFFGGFIVSAIVYYILVRVWPPAGLPRSNGWDEVNIDSLSWRFGDDQLEAISAPESSDSLSADEQKIREEEEKKRQFEV
ncbi:RNA-splicing factor [Ascosphaera pollenicola]|nr:RNA-splicing factor [Ascosphaera pollenicola]